MMWGIVAVKFIIFCAFSLRSVAVYRTYNEKTELPCFEHQEGGNKIYQNPWNTNGCLSSIDVTLLVLAGLSFVGVFLGVIVSLDSYESCFKFLGFYTTWHQNIQSVTLYRPYWIGVCKQGRPQNGSSKE